MRATHCSLLLAKHYCWPATLTRSSSCRDAPQSWPAVRGAATARRSGQDGPVAWAILAAVSLELPNARKQNSPGRRAAARSLSMAALEPTFGHCRRQQAAQRPAPATSWPQMAASSSLICIILIIILLLENHKYNRQTGVLLSSCSLCVCVSFADEPRLWRMGKHKELGRNTSSTRLAGGILNERRETVSHSLTFACPPERLDLESFAIGHERQQLSNGSSWQGNK